MLPEMNSGELTSEQIKVLQEQLKPHFLYLKRLLERMEQRGFNPNDEIFKAAKDVYGRLHSLRVRLHYLGCDPFKREFEAEWKAKGKPSSPWGT